MTNLSALGKVATAISKHGSNNWRQNPYNKHQVLADSGGCAMSYVLVETFPDLAEYVAVANPEVILGLVQEVASTRGKPWTAGWQDSEAMIPPPGQEVVVKCSFGKLVLQVNRRGDGWVEPDWTEHNVNIIPLRGTKWLELPPE